MGLIISKEQAVENAIRFARELGLPVDRYSAEAVLEDDTWNVHFFPNANAKPGPGEFFTVVIDGREVAPPRIVHGK